MRRLRHWLSGLLLATVLISVFSMTAYAEEDKTIRIGLYNKDGYHVIDDNNRHSGYDHEYLMEISKYTGWRYEFVEGTWQECITMLENGEIDLLGGVAKNEAWAYTMNYAAEPSAYSSNCLLVGKESVRYAYEDFAAFDQMRIGVLSNSTINDDLQKYSKEHQFTYTLYPYDTEAELVDALTQGKIDCAGLSDFRNLSHYKIIARMSDTPLYYVTSPQRADLKAELDDALQKIHEQNKYYEYHLYDKYFMFAHQIAFTREEQEYIKEHQQIEVALFRDIPMICTFNEFTGQYEGFIITILDKLSQKTGFQFTYVPLPENQMPWDYLHNHPNALLAPLFQNELIHYSEEMCFLDTIVPSQMVAVTQEAENFSYPNGLQELTLVIPEGMFGATQEIEELFPGCEILFCQGHQEGLDMVRHGEADLTLINEVLWTYLSQSPRYDELDSTYLNHIVEDITIGIGTSSDTMLMSILNKAIQSFSRRDIQQIVMEYTSAHPYQLTLREKLYTNGQSILLLLLSVIAVIVLRIVHQRRKKSLNEEMKKREIAEAKLKTAEEYQDKLFQQANFDSLTGLYNRKYFIEKCDELLLQNPDKTYVFYHINLSDFKMVNEIYGMQQGDLVLLKVAAYLKKSVVKMVFTVEFMLTSLRFVIA